jgi:hypothetical protein
MEVKLRLAKAIGLAYYASHSQNGPHDSTANLIEKILNHLKLPEDKGTERERSSLIKARSIVVWMKSRGFEQPFDLNDLMTRLRAASGEDDRLYDLFSRSLLLVDDPDAARDKVRDISSEMHEFIAVEEFENLLRRASRQLGFDREKIEDVRSFREELILKLQALPFENRAGAGSAFRCLDITNLESVADVFHKAQLAVDPRAILKLAYKALNRMTGSQGGARRGEYSNVSALPGQNKTGNLLDTFVAMNIFNEPVLFDETKKPLNIYVTIEDKLELVMEKLYVLLMQHEFGLPVVVNAVSPAEMAEYVHRRLSKNGHHVRIMELPGGTSSDAFLDEMRAFQDQGFEIISIGLDYTNLIGKQGIPAQVAGDETQLLVRKVRSWTSPNDIYTYSAHQLSTDAKTLARQFPDDYLKRLQGKGYYEGCKKLDTEFDYEYMVAKTKHGGEWWQEFNWCKHRKVGTTLEQDKYFAMKFQEYPMLGLKYDQDLEVDLSYSKVGGRNNVSQGGYDFANFDDD